MTDQTISGDFGQFTINAADTRWIVPESANGTTVSGAVIIGPSQYTGTEIDVAGHLTSGDSAGIDVQADGTIIDVVETGVIDGHNGIALNASDQQVTNSGEINAANFGILYGTNANVVNDGKIYSDFIGIAGNVSGATIENNGLIKAPSDIYVLGDDVQVDLGAKSKLVATETSDNANRFALWREGDADQFLTVKNAGLINGNVQDGDGGSKFTNKGRIVGDVHLGGGDDYFDTSHGTVSGVIDGGTGNDTFVISSAQTLINEGRLEGTDTVVSSVSISFASAIYKAQELENLTLSGKAAIDGTGNQFANMMTGNIAGNKLSGGAGDDILAGGHGDDRLKGGSGADTFVFHGGDGHDLVQDLNDGDMVDIVNWEGIDNYLKVLKHAHDEGSDVVISSGNDTLTLHGLHKADLLQTEFEFSV